MLQWQSAVADAAGPMSKMIPAATKLVGPFPEIAQHAR